jgi:hypothetical protein
MAYTNIDDPSAYFQVALHSSAGPATITNDGNSDLQPDLIWSKARGAAHNHGLFDSTRGVTKFLESNTTTAEGTASAGFDLISFDTDGFSTGNNQFNTICGNTTYVAWQWKANGGTTSSNTDGSITSTVQANQDAGFSIVTYTGTGVYNKTVGHGLGATPAVVIVKNRTSADTSYDDWWVFHHKTSNPINRVLALNEIGAEVSTTVFWSVLPSSTIFGVGGSTNAPRYTNGASQDYIAYCFAEKQGYSKFGKYIGNGNADGTFVYTGFKPAFLMVKRSDSTSSWQIKDSARNPNNLADKTVFANLTNTEYSTFYFYDLLSNGFKVRGTDGELNASGGSYIYMAFAESPFTTSTGIPTTAR